MFPVFGSIGVYQISLFGLLIEFHFLHLLTKEHIGVFHAVTFNVDLLHQCSILPYILSGGEVLVAYIAQWSRFTQHRHQLVLHIHHSGQEHHV